MSRKRFSGLYLLTQECALEVPPTEPSPLLSQFSYNDKYVVQYDFSNIDPRESKEELCILIHDLEAVGLQVSVRRGHDQTLLIFVKAPRHLLGQTVYKSRVKDWLYGIIPTRPNSTTDTAHGDYEAEDLLAMHHLVNHPKSLGGAGITPGHGQWKNVKSIFPLHQTSKNTKLLRHLGKKLFLGLDDLDMLRDLLGAKVAFYFAFTQTYTIALIFPALTGCLARALLPPYSLVYAILTTLWCTVFLEYWKIKEIDLCIRWRVKGIARIKVDRPQFRYEKIIVDDVGREKRIFPKWKSIAYETLQIPFMLVAALTLGALIVFVFGVEALISEGYHGPYKWYLEYLPTILLAVAIPYISQFLEDVADVITNLENHRTQDSHEVARTQKIFVLNFITNYLPIFWTAFIYIPFGGTILPYIEAVLEALIGDESTFSVLSFATDPSRLRNEVIALTLTGQISHFGEEFLFPFIKQSLQRWWREYRVTHASPQAGLPLNHDHPDDVEVLTAARNQAVLQPYNVHEDMSQMVIQFGHLALFSPVWPLVPIGFLLNNWFELRSDFLKICIEHQRPVPVRNDGIGSWIHSLAFLNWLGSISTAAVVHIFAHSSLGYHGFRGVVHIAGKSSPNYVWWTLPITIFVSEHVFLLLRALVQMALQQVGSQQIRRERDDEYRRRKWQLDELESNNLSRLGVDEWARHRKRSFAENQEAFFHRQAEEGVSLEVAEELIGSLKGLKRSNTGEWEKKRRGVWKDE